MAFHILFYFLWFLSKSCKKRRTDFIVIFLVEVPDDLQLSGRLSRLGNFSVSRCAALPGPAGHQRHRRRSRSLQRPVCEEPRLLQHTAKRCLGSLFQSETLLPLCGVVWAKRIAKYIYESVFCVSGAAGSHGWSFICVCGNISGCCLLPLWTHLWPIY